MSKVYQELKSKSLFVTGIDTGIGKTVVSAIIKEALKADYWKPVQCGDLDQSDTLKVKSLSSPQGQFFKERFSLKNPLSPHQAAEREGLNISLSDFALPQTKNWLVVEGAGGVLVPLNDKETVLDLIEKLKMPAIVVTKNYLGSLNHTLLTVSALVSKNIPIAGLIFNGKENPELERFLCKKTGLPHLLSIQEEKSLSKKVITKYANQLIQKGVFND
tara:strand:- start:1580 stop:2230 length:651 start_codon:yes stop_codon:yes gene_type:complete